MTTKGTSLLFLARGNRNIALDKGLMREGGEERGINVDRKITHRELIIQENSLIITTKDTEGRMTLEEVEPMIMVLLKQ